MFFYVVLLFFRFISFFKTVFILNSLKYVSESILTNVNFHFVGEVFLNISGCFLGSFSNLKGSQ